MGQSLNTKVIVSGIADSLQKQYPQESIQELIDRIKSGLSSFISMGIVPLEGLEELIRECLTLEYNEDTQILQDGPITPWFMDFKKNPNSELIRWNRYAQHLRQNKGWDPKVVSKLDKTTDQIMDQLFNPNIPGKKYNLRGMVVGDVQSGKTANYIGLCSKAFDSGYKLIIVLAGLHNNLRSQTQARIEEDLLGYRQYSDGDSKNQIGVRKINPIILDKTFTTSEEKGDFNSYSKKTSPIFNEKDSTILVVKKNGTVLDSLIDYLKKQPITQLLDGVSTINNYPLLIIDDECDQASINTKCMKKYLKSSEKEKVHDLDIDPTSINRKIRELLNLFSQSVYVGYTATPYANIFIDPNAPENNEIGKDLFPKDFIVSLPTSNSYTGAKLFFRDLLYRDNLFIPVEDSHDLIEKRPRQKPVIKGLNRSLKNAIFDFLIVTSIRRQRGSKDHNSMLIHVSHITDNQKEISLLVNDYVESLCNRVQFEPDFIDEFKYYWEQNFKIKSQEILGDKFHDKWDNIKEELLRIAQLNEIKVKEINGSSGDVLEYLNTSNGIFIAVGGNKLSRGLTLEGLTVSYYLRTSSTYDTLMQMGRWFGYRSKYIDLCRIYTTKELMESFQSVSEAEEELRDLITYMSNHNHRPIEFSLRVQKHPSLKPTSQNKMRGIQSIKYSLSGTRSQITAFDKNDLEYNYKLAEQFIQSLTTSRGKANPRRNSYIFENISPSEIINFLMKYKIGNQEIKSKVVSPESWSEYIKKMNKIGELTDWTVGIYSLKDGDFINFSEYEIMLPKRTVNINNEKYLTINVVTNPESEFLDFTDEDENYIAFKNKNMTNTQLRSHRSKTKGILNFYILDVMDNKVSLNFPYNPISLEISFPFSENSVDVKDYYVNLVEDGEYAE